MWLMEWDTSLAQPLFLLFVLVLRMTGCEQRPSTFTDFASVNLRASRFENIWPWTAFRDIFCQAGVVFDVALFLFRRAMGNLMSRVQDGTAEQAANASQRRAAGWVSGLIYLMNTITALVCTCTKSTFKVFVLKCWRNKISQRWRSRVLLTKICNELNGLVVLCMLPVTSCNCGKHQYLTVIVPDYIQTGHDRWGKDWLTDYW